MSSKALATGSLLTACTFILLYLTILLPTNTLTLLTLTSFMSIVALLRQNMKTALLVYLASSILSFFFIPLQITLLYSVFFGLYGLIKAFIEKLKNLLFEYVLKLLFFNLIFFILKEIMILFVPNTFNHLSFGLIFFIGQIVFLIFDYALTMLIAYYVKHFPSI